MPSSIYFITLIVSRMRQDCKSIFIAPIHTIVTLSIAIGVAFILIASMVMLGFQSEIKKKITSFVGHFEVIKHNHTAHLSETTSLQTTQMSGLMTNLPKEVKKVTTFVRKFMLLHTSIGIEGILCQGLDPMVAHKALGDYVILGRLPNLVESGYQDELLISHHLAQKLSIKLGDRVVVHTMHPIARCRKLKVVGIYCTYLNEIDAHVAFCDMRLIQRLNNWTSETVNGYEIFLKDGVVVTKVLREAILRLIGNDLHLIRADRKYATLYDWLAIIHKNTVIFIVFILLIAGFTMVATVMIQFMERSYMVGLLKALGAYVWQVNIIILCNSLRTLFRGMLYGNILGIGLCFLQHRYRLVTLEPQLYYISYVPVYWSWQSILFLNLLIFGSVCVALYFAITLLRHKKITEVLQADPA